MKNSFKYFENRDCKFYPCHNKIEQINCMFCYCPLYRINDCGGNYNIININGKELKDCSNCVLPHKPENYEYVIQRLTKNS